jgi:hypothetical protein
VLGAVRIGLFLRRSRRRPNCEKERTSLWEGWMTRRVADMFEVTFWETAVQGRKVALCDTGVHPNTHRSCGSER